MVILSHLFFKTFLYHLLVKDNQRIFESQNFKIHIIKIHSHDAKVNLTGIKPVAQKTIRAKK